MDYNNNNSLPIPSIPVSVKIGVDPQSAAITASFIFVAMLLALLIFGYVFKR